MMIQVCSILLDLCAVKGRMGLAEEIASLMDTHGIRKGEHWSLSVCNMSNVCTMGQWDRDEDRYTGR